MRFWLAILFDSCSFFSEILHDDIQKLKAWAKAKSLSSVEELFL